MEQLSFDTEISDERKSFELIYPQLSDIIDNAAIDSGVLIFKELNNCSSVYFLNVNMVFFQVRLRKKTKYLLLPENYEGELPGDVTICRSKSDPGMIRITMSSPDDILLYVSILRNILMKLSQRYQVFGCCSRYEDCSNARACIHPDVKFALGCQYRCNLKKGKIFYGKNKTI